MRTIPSPEMDLWLGNGEREFRVRVRRPDEVSWTNLSAILGGDWVLRVQTEGDNPDQPAGTFTVQFLKHATEGSLSPGISASSLNIDAATEYRPLVHPGRPIEVDARVDAEPWRLWLQGEIDDVEWPGAEITATCRTLDGVLVDAQIESEEESGLPDPGNPIADEIQDLLDRWLDTPPTLLTVGTPGWNVGTYRPAVGSLGSQVLSLAQARGWDLRYRWYETDSNYRLTLYLPPRDKVTPDLLLSTTDLIEVAGLRQSRLHVRNHFPVVYDGGTVLVQDLDSIAEYRKRAMPMVEPDMDSTEATALANYARSDLAWPLIDGRYRIPFLPWLELHDLLTLEADDDHFDYDTDFAVVGLSHVVDPAEGAWTYLDLRGGAPVGQYLSWIARSRTPAEDLDAQITERKVGRTEAEVTLQGVPGSRVAEVWAYEALVDEPFDPEDWPDPAVDTPVDMYSAATFLADGHAAAIPSEGKVRAVVLVTKDANGLSLWDWRYAVYPTRADPSIIDVAVTNQMVQVVGGPGVRSIRMAHRGGTWVAFYDGQGLTINVALADALGVAGIGAAATWTIDVDAYGVPKTEVTVGVTPSAARSTTVYGTSVSGSTAPQWEVILATAPANLSSDMNIRLRAGGLSGHTAKLYAKSNTGTGWSAEADITASVSPALSTAPSTNTDYTWDCGFTRDDGDPRPRTVTFQIRAELLSGATVVDNDWDEVAFTTGP